MNAVGEGANAALRARPPQTEVISAPESSPSANGNTSAPANSTAPPPAADPDASPATALPKLKRGLSSAPPEPTDEPAKPAPVPALSPVVSVEEPPKDAGAADGSEASSSDDGVTKKGEENLDGV